MNNQEKNDLQVGCAIALALGIIYVLIWFAIYSAVAGVLLFLLTLVAPTVTFSLKFVLIVGGAFSLLRFIL